MMNKKKYKYGIHFSILTAAIVGFIVSFLFDEYPNVFSVLIGITSGAFSSALVAWLIEQGNDKRQTTKDKQVMDALMEKFDSRVKHTLEFGLNNCMKLSDEDIKEEYSIREINDMLLKLPCDNVYFKHYHEWMSIACEGVNIIPTLTFENYDCIKIFNYFETLRNNIVATRRFQENEIDEEIIKEMCVTSITFIEGIYQERGMDIKVVLSEKDINYIKSFRKARESICKTKV